MITGSTISLPPSSYTATDDGAFSTSTTAGTGTSLATGGGFVPAKLLLHADGTDGSTTFTDEMGKTVTAYGNAQIDTAQSKFGGASGLFDGAGDYLSLADSEDWNFTDGDYTIDFRVKFNSLASISGLGGNLNNTSDTAMYVYADGRVGIGVAGINEISTSAGVVTTGTWYHIAYVRTGSTTKIFVDGVEKASATTAVWTNSANPLRLGGYTYGSTFYGLNGWMDEIRFSKGIARWTSNFTPPTSAYIDDSTFSSTAITGSGAGASVGLATTSNPVAYWKMDGNWNDSKGTNHGSAGGSATFTSVSGDYKYGTAGGTFDGDDYVLLPDLAETSDGTIEGWFNPTSNITSSSGRKPLVANWTISGGNGGPTTFLVWNDLGTGLSFGHWNGGIWYSISAGAGHTWTAGNWYHVVATWGSGGLKLYVNNVLVASSSSTYSASGQATNWTIGGTVNPNYYFTGKIDEVAVYNTALSAESIASHYNGWWYGSPSGTFESATIDLGGKASLGNLDFSSTLSSSGAWSQTSDSDFNGTNSSTAVSGGSVGLGIDESVIDFNKITIDTSTGGHTVGLKTDGTVVGVGRGPDQINVSGWTNIKAITTGALRTVGLKNDGTVIGTGLASFGALDVSGWTNIKAVASGLDHTVGLKTDGTVVGTGHNGAGQINVSGWTNIKAIVAGQNTTVGLKTGGTVVGAGDNTYGQLNVSGWTNIKAIAAGERHTIGLKNDGTVVGAGDNTYGQLNVSGWTNIKAISAGDYTNSHTVGLKNDGTVVGAGDNTYGQLNVSGWTNIKAIDAGYNDTVGLKTDGTVVGVGRSYYGQLNVSGWTNIKQPTYGYPSSGTYTSPVKPVGPGAGFGTMSWVATTNGQTVTMKVRSCNDSACSGETSFSSLSNATSGQDISSLTGVSDSDGYVQYQATFTTTDIMITPTLDSVTINITPLALQIATSDSSSGPWTYYGPDGATDTYFTSTGAAIPSALSGYRYFRYKAYIATADTAYTPTLNSVTLNYTQYSASGALISSKYDAIGDDSLITALSWSASNTSATETIKFQIRSASSSEGLDSAIWCGYSESSTSTCSGNNYFTSSDNGSALSSTHPLRNGVNDRWLQYKVILESAQGATPTLSSVSVQYVVNAPPAFDSSFGTNGISVNQIATSTDVNWGKILAEYRIKDEDTVTGYASTTFAYRLNSSDGWTSISTSYVNPNVERRDISPAFSSTSTIWNAKSQIGEAYSTTTQIKIIINDLDAANNIGSSTSAVFTLDTKNPLVNSFNINVSSATTSFAFSDDSNIQYRVSNNADFSTDGNNQNEWQTVGATSTNFSGSWNFAGLPENSRIYYEVRDIYGNYAVLTSDAVPGVGVQNNSALNIKDLSSAGANEWREFISWYPYSATTSAAFGSYQVYRSTDGNNYSLYRTITDSTENFLLDTSVSSSTTYYYKVRFVDSDGDISGFSAVASDLIDGQGGSDFVAPVISNASSTEVQSTWAKITWTTDELSDSKVEYGTSGSYNSSSTDQTWIDANATHTIILTGLNPSTAYNFRIKSKDILNNEGVATGYSFTTLSGAAISGVSCSDTTDNSITVVWNTDADASSYVDYSTSATFSSYNSTSPSSLIGEAGSIFQQKVEITGLSSGTKYYIKAKSLANNVTSIYPESGVFFCNTTSDSKPPRITQVQEALISDANAVITWRTDEPATSQVEYGAVASTTTGNYATSTSKDTTLTLSHFVTLSGLSPETNYYYRVKSWDNNGTENSQTAVSDENDFKTNVAGQTTVVIYRGGGGSFTPVQEQPKDTTSPYAMNIEVVDIGAFSANVNFDTDEGAKTIVEYGYAAGEYDKNEASFASGFQTKHAIKLSNLKMGTDYHFRIQTVDKSGNIGYSIDQTFTTKYFAEVAKDLISFERTYEIQKEIEESIESILPSILPPFVENPRVSDITENSATIKWRTNIPAYSIVSYASERDYDTTKLNPYFAEASDMSEKKTSHEINLIGLTSNSTYNIKVKSFSLPKAVGESKNIEFTTLASKVKARIADIKKDALRVVWTTDTPATSIVEYKNTRTGEINRKIKDARETDHDIVIENLAPDTSYEVRAMGYNEKGNLVEAGEAIVVRTSKDVKSPTISNIKIDNALVPGRTDKIQTVVSWKTDEMATSIVEYEEGSAKVGEELTNKEGSADTYAENHTVIVTKLRPGALYKIRVVSTDEANNKSVSPTRTIITPRQTESIVDVIVKNFEETFQFLKKIQ